MATGPERKIYRFGVFEADTITGELRKSGVRMRLQEQPFRVLTILIERRGEVVGREELRQKLWPADTFVDFDHSLNTIVNKLREVLGDSAANPRFIETLAKRGYRFVSPVETVVNGTVPSASATSLAPEEAQSESASSFLTHPDEVPRVTRDYVRVLFSLIQVHVPLFLYRRPGSTLGRRGTA